MDGSKEDYDGGLHAGLRTGSYLEVMSGKTQQTTQQTTETETHKGAAVLGSDAVDKGSAAATSPDRARNPVPLRTLFRFAHMWHRGSNTPYTMNVAMACRCLLACFNLLLTGRVLQLDHTGCCSVCCSYLASQ